MQQSDEPVMAGHFIDSNREQVLLKKDVGTLTELCSTKDLPEIEIVSLVQEAIPNYKLRADTLTQFSGYEHQDWFVPHPALPDDKWEVQLSPQVARETLNYMVLSGKRVSQMTRTYNDIESVTRLLEEKEKDLELTARIGQELLTHNNQLETQVAVLEAQLKEEQDRLVQTQHELAKKSELLAVLAAEDDHSDPNTPTAGKSITLELLQRKVASLELQNGLLKDEARQLAAETTAIEEKEKQLVKDITLQLGLASQERSTMSEELARLKEENRTQLEELQLKTARLSQLEISNQELSADNSFISSQLATTKHTQDLLCTEILELKEQYAQVLGLLNEAQEQIRKYRKKHLPSARVGPAYNPPLGTELETSLLSDSSLDSGVSVDKPIPSYRRVFETVRSASRAASSSGGSSNPSPAHRMFGTASTTLLTSASSSGPKMSSYYPGSSPSPYRPPLVSQDAISLQSSIAPQSLESNHSMSLSEEMGLSGQRIGVPGQPGSLDLEVALGRISAHEVLRRRQHMTSDVDIDSYFCRTPDSIMSTGSSSGMSGATWRLPEKLQIVKPMEGSLTLHQWSQLARPNLGSALAERPCVVARGQSSGSDEAPLHYTLDDLEEEDWETSHPGKQFEPAGHTFTYTNSTVLHPEDLTQVTSSYHGLQMSAPLPGTRPSSPPGQGTPCNMSRRNSTSTFSTSLGLAKMLNERGITAATSTPSISACATPCNSPERPSSPEPSAAPRLGFFACGAEILRRTLSSEAKEPRKSKRKSPIAKGLSNMRLVDKIEEVGLDTILRPPEGARLLRNVGPMSQLAGRRLSSGSTSGGEGPSNAQSSEKTRSVGRGRTPGSQQRRDLGTVQPRASSNKDTSSNNSSGIINCLLFGRKGGLF